MLSKLPERKSFSKTVHEKLRSAILEGKINPGSRLVERALAEKMGISRTPVHEALNVLVAEKLVKKMPNNGFVVARIEENDIIQLYTIRMHLETLAVQWALPNLTPKTINRLKKNVARMEKCILKSDMGGAVEADSQFHQTILYESQNNVLVDFVELLQRNVRLYRMYSFSLPGRSAQITAEHKEIIETLEKRDEAQAAECMKKHLNNAMSSILFSLKPSEENEVI